ncbi:MAG: exosortase, partial [bacterium]|nr:exosortase [bacterium]
MVVAYYEVLIWLYGRYTNPDSYYSHGFLIPFVSGYFIWKKRMEFAGLRAESSKWGLVLIIVACLFHVAGTVLYVFSVSGFSLFILIVGCSLFLLGGRITQIILFPLVLLLFMLPVPEAFVNLVVFPMKMLVAKAGVYIVRLLGIPVYREGFYISIPGGDLIVGNPCSGLRS